MGESLKRAFRLADFGDECPKAVLRWAERLAAPLELAGPPEGCSQQACSGQDYLVSAAVWPCCFPTLVLHDLQGQIASSLLFSGNGQLNEEGAALVQLAQHPYSAAMRLGNPAHD